GRRRLCPSKSNGSQWASGVRGRPRNGCPATRFHLPRSVARCDTHCPRPWQRGRSRTAPNSLHGEQHDDPSVSSMGDRPTRRPAPRLTAAGPGPRHAEGGLIDYLETRPEVDKKRIAATGMSMGCTRSWWLAAIDDRVQAIVGVACFTRYTELLAHGNLRMH